MNKLCYLQFLKLQQLGKSLDQNEKMSCKFQILWVEEELQGEFQYIFESIESAEIVQGYL